MRLNGYAASCRAQGATMPHGAISISPPKALRMLTPVPDEGRHDDGLAAALAGLTGIDFLDVWMRELVATGYLHNRARI